MPVSYTHLDVYKRQPTSSTTAALAYGDALALALLSKRKFTASQFAVFHPGGSLGRKLLLTVEDIMHSGADNPVVNGATTVQDALFVITDKGLGAVSVVDDNEIMIGVLTDGDIRRGLSKGIDLSLIHICAVHRVAELVLRIAEEKQ